MKITKQCANCRYNTPTVNEDPCYDCQQYSNFSAAAPINVNQFLLTATIEELQRISEDAIFFVQHCSIVELLALDEYIAQLRKAREAADDDDEGEEA